MQFVQHKFRNIFTIIFLPIFLWKPSKMICRLTLIYIFLTLFTHICREFSKINLSYSSIILFIREQRRFAGINAAYYTINLQRKNCDNLHIVRLLQKNYISLTIYANMNSVVDLLFVQFILVQSISYNPKLT